MRVKYATKMRIKWAKSGDPGQNLGYDIGSTHLIIQASTWLLLKHYTAVHRYQWWIIPKERQPSLTWTKHYNKGKMSSVPSTKILKEPESWCKINQIRKDVTVPLTPLTWCSSVYNHTDNKRYYGPFLVVRGLEEASIHLQNPPYNTCLPATSLLWPWSSSSFQTHSNGTRRKCALRSHWNRRNKQLYQTHRRREWNWKPYPNNKCF